MVSAPARHDQRSDADLSELPKSTLNCLSRLAALGKSNSQPDASKFVVKALTNANNASSSLASDLYRIKDENGVTLFP